MRRDRDLLERSSEHADRVRTAYLAQNWLKMAIFFDAIKLIPLG